MKAANCNGPAMMSGICGILQLAALITLLGGCSTFSFKRDGGPPPEPNVLPTNYRAKLRDFLQDQLTDASSVRGAFISEPKLQPVGNDNRYVICVRYDSKDGYGRYTGVRDNIAIYFNGDLTQYLPATPEQCGNAAYLRFPEIENLKKPGT